MGHRLIVNDLESNLSLNKSDYLVGHFSHMRVEYGRFSMDDTLLRIAYVEDILTLSTTTIMQSMGSLNKKP